MKNIRVEEKFKELLEDLILRYSAYNNIISFIEDVSENDDVLSLAKDFSEELSLYESDIERIFGVDIFNIDYDTLNISFINPIIDNIATALSYISDLTPENFEKLCAIYIKFLGTTGDPKVTRKAHDQGIDYIGVVERSERSKLFSSESNVNRYYLIGQAKHYEKDKVTSKEIRELAGSIYLLKYKGFALKDNPYSDLSLKAFTPIYVYFITSNYFSESAKRLCFNADIIPIDRMILAITFGLDVSYQDSGLFASSKLSQAINNINFF
ncbi:restriction endonuclease [Paenibacillus sp. YYML68]|uniref:restriction endonuclease n=1 Tax=Paenibacillus sp. YYML68 TaxID=2909250 RepID=UPI00248FEFFE|nr:restriction endonuclease [Paenibacillus sp. YYML68]